MTGVVADIVDDEKWKSKAKQELVVREREEVG